MKYFSLFLSVLMPLWSGAIAFGYLSPSLWFQITAWSVAVVGLIGLFFAWIACDERFLGDLSGEDLQNHLDWVGEHNVTLRANFRRFTAVCTAILCYLSGFYWLAGIWAVALLIGYFVQYEVEESLFAEAVRRSEDT